jgi:hypothetical protein
VYSLVIGQLQQLTEKSALIFPYTDREQHFLHVNVERSSTNGGKHFVHLYDFSIHWSHNVELHNVHSLIRLS